MQEQCTRRKSGALQSGKKWKKKLTMSRVSEILSTSTRQWHCQYTKVNNVHACHRCCRRCNYMTSHFTCTEKCVCPNWLLQHPVGSANNVAQPEQSKITFGHLLKTVSPEKGYGRKPDWYLICLQSEHSQIASFSTSHYNC